MITQKFVDLMVVQICSQRSGLGDVADFGKRQADKRKPIKVNKSMVNFTWLMLLRRPETEAPR